MRSRISQDKYFGLSNRIARWKIDTHIENWLACRADFSNWWKRVYILYYKIFDRKYYKTGVSMAKDIIHTHQKEFRDYDESYIVMDMIYSLHRFGASFLDYQMYNFIGRDAYYKNSFVSDKLRYHYCDVLNDASIEQIMTDKYRCYQSYKDFYDRDIIGCYSEDDIGRFLKFFSEHESFIIKPMNGNSGHGVEVILSSSVDDSVCFYKEKIKKGPFVVEELIKQGQELSVLHAESVNTLRIMTFVLNENVKIIGAVLRMGVGKSKIDNAGSGGIFASIDYENGIVQSDAIDFKGNHYNFHPDTNTQIVGFRLPEWQRAQSFINDLAFNINGTTLVAWDIAYSENGWTLVEANDNGAWRVMQSNNKVGLKAILYSYMDMFLSIKVKS